MSVRLTKKSTQIRIRLSGVVHRKSSLADRRADPVESFLWVVARGDESLVRQRQDGQLGDTSHSSSSHSLARSEANRMVPVRGMMNRS